MPSTDPIRVLIAGSGFGAKVHAPGFAQNPEFRIVGIASGHLETARAAAEAHGVPYATDDWKRMLEEVDADLVSIVTPACVASGCDVATTLSAQIGWRREG